MSTKTPFTSTDVNKKMDEIRRADDATVEREAHDVETDFNKWLLHNFELTDSQIDYLLSLGSDFSKSTGTNIGQAFRKRNPVTMEKGEMQSRSIKFVREEQVQRTTYAPGTVASEDEALNYFIS